MSREVVASGWPYGYRAYVVQYDGWFRKGWRYVIEQKWVHWRYHKTSRVFKTEKEAVFEANKWLNHKDGSKDWEGRKYV